jgi:hypothetical protein
MHCYIIMITIKKGLGQNNIGFKNTRRYNTKMAFNFAALPQDAQYSVLVHTPLTEASLQVFGKEYEEVMQNRQFASDVVNNVILQGDTNPLILLVKRNLVDEQTLLDIMNTSTYEERHMNGLVTLIALCAVLRWTQLGQYTVEVIDKIGVWDIKSLIKGH